MWLISSKISRSLSFTWSHSCRFLYRCVSTQDDHAEVFRSLPTPRELILQSTFRRERKSIPIHGLRLDECDSSLTTLNLYCCGPTVYAASHLGHAISYIRCDLLIRTLKSILNLDIVFAMNITDIDDKIIAKSNELGVNYKQLSTEHYHSFLSDMNSLRVQPADSYLKVTDHISVICEYIKQLYDRGFAYYSAETGDINFDYDHFVQTFSIQDDIHRQRALQTTKSQGKKSPKDFALWKASKTGEPKWDLQLGSQCIQGRPGWHVECSALSDYIFGSKVDIHYGGFDLIFPHHHCESCCSHAYLYKPSHGKPLYSSANAWLHSGHLILRSEKMSKSLGNVVLIKDFIQQYSANVLRLLCIRTHYRSEIDFNLQTMQEMSAYDEKLCEFVKLIDLYIYNLSTSSSLTGNTLSESDHHVAYDMQTNTSLSMLISQVEQQIVAGILDDLDLNAGLEEIIKLSGHLPQILAACDDPSQRTLLRTCIRLRLLLHRWLNATGLDYGQSGSHSASGTQFSFINHLINFRTDVRQMALDTLRSLKQLDPSVGADNKPEIASMRKQAQQILARCDDTRSFLELHGIKLKDQQTSRSSS